jgi:hypothetical protein
MTFAFKSRRLVYLFLLLKGSSNLFLFMNEDWSKKEVQLIVGDYFNMLSLELTNKKYNKSAFRQALFPMLDKRSEGSIEFKHQNISAVLANMGLPFIRGYKPRFNYQQILEEEVGNFLQTNRNVYEPSFENFADATISTNKLNVDFDNIIGEEPEQSQVAEHEPTYRPIKINYLKKEQDNRTLGERGEELVISYEQYRLIKAGKENLADKIEWVSKERGDGTGYDVLSKNVNGTDRYIEVKTTKLTKETPIYLSKTEVSFAILKKQDFYLYRVYNFDSKPQIFIKNDQYGSFCTLLPESFKGYF